MQYSGSGGDFREQLAWMGQLPRGGARVVLSLIVAGRPVPASELAMMVGVKERSLSETLRWLAALGVVERAERGCWTMSAATRAMVGEASGIASGGNSGSGIASGSDGVRTGARTSPPPKRSTPISVSGMDESFLEEEEGSGATARNRHLVEQLLLRAGVGRRSQKLQQLLGLGLDPDYVEGWVMYRERRIEAGKDMPVGWLIQAIQDGDAVPACECGECDDCFRRRLGRYADVVMR